MTARGREPHVHTESSRIATRSILQMGQIPFLSSMISGCIGQVYEIGGRFSLCAGVDGCIAVVGGPDNGMTKRRAADIRRAFTQPSLIPNPWSPIPFILYTLP